MKRRSSAVLPLPSANGRAQRRSRLLFAFGYYSKTRYLLEQGLELDEVVAYIDISDVQDEALAYRPRDDGVVEGVTLDAECPSAMHVASVDLPWWTRISYTLD